MSRGSWLWEAHSVVFYGVWRLWEGQILTDRVYPSRVFGVLESLEVGSDEFLGDHAPGRLHAGEFGCSEV